MIDTQQVSSLIKVLKLPQNTDFFMIKRAFKTHLVQQRQVTTNLLECYQNMRKENFSIPSHVNGIWDCKTKNFVSLESLPIWPVDMVFSKSFNDSILLAFFHDVGAAWNAQNMKAVQLLAKQYKEFSQFGLFIGRRFYLTPQFCAGLNLTKLWSIFYFAAQNSFLEIITHKHFTNQLNINFYNLYATINGKYKWLNGKKVLKSSSEKIYTSYANLKAP